MLASNGSFIKMKRVIGGVEFDLIRRNVKSIRIKIDRDGDVCLIIPNHCSEKAGIDFFVAKYNWVKQKVDLKPKKRTLNFENGEFVYIFGKKYDVIAQIAGKSSWDIDGYKLIIKAKDIESQSVKNCYESILKKVLKARAREYIEKWEKITGLKATSLSIRKTVSRWGSCNCQSGAINLSLYLACLPEFCLDYVVLHEICHIKYSNHGEYFKRELDKFMPNWREIRRFLKDNANEYLYK